MAPIDDRWPEENFYFRSDHYNFARNGVPILFFFNGVHPDYHQVSDSPDKIDSRQDEPDPAAPVLPGPGRGEQSAPAEVESGELREDRDQEAGGVGGWADGECDNAMRGRGEPAMVPQARQLPVPTGGGLVPRSVGAGGTTRARP